MKVTGLVDGVVDLVCLLRGFQILLRKPDVWVFIEIYDSQLMLTFVPRGDLPSPRLPSSLSCSIAKSSSPLDWPLGKSSSESMVVRGGVSAAEGAVFVRFTSDLTCSF